MKIEQLDVEGFRSLQSVSWRPGSLNVVVGPNASGKSNLLAALALLASSVEGRLGRAIDRAGGMPALAWNGTAEQIRFDLLAGGDEQVEPTGYRLELGRLGTSSDYTVDAERLYLRNRDAPPETLIERTGTHAGESGEGQRLRGSSVGGESLFSTDVASFAHRPEPLAFRDWMAAWSVYGGFSTQPDTPVRRPTLVRHETRLDPAGDNLVSVLHTLYEGSFAFKRDLDLAMHAGLGDDFESLVFAPDAEQRVQLRVRRTSSRREQTAAELSDGTLRFLFLIAALAHPEPPSLVVLDEPDLGLHPSVLPVVAELAQAASHRTQVVLTTHSAELLSGFRACTDGPVVTVVAREEGATTIRTLDRTVLDEWLRSDTLGSLFRSGELESMP